MTWTIDTAPSDQQIRAWLVLQPIWTAYALGDLQPPFRQRSQFILAENDDEWAIVLMYRTSTFTALIPFGPAAGVAAIFEAVAAELPEHCIVSSVTGELQALIDRWYTIVGTETLIYRMSVTEATFKPFSGFVECEKLSMDDMSEMTGFYAMNNVPTFSPDQVQHGIYYGIRRHGILVAVGGTHFINRHDKIAAVGNLYTDPILRGKGYARSLISKLARDLFDMGCEHVIINIEKDDFSTMQIYESLGFTSFALFYESTVKRKA